MPGQRIAPGLFESPPHFTAASRREGRLDAIRWGILGTGRIAGDFATALGSLPDAELVAVGSRSPETAAAFAARFAASRWYGSYEELATDPNIDIIYIATPHALHLANAQLCLEHGKAVLVEKPFTLTGAQARNLVTLARERRLFLMEAMWTRCLPALIESRRRIDDGAIGEPRFLVADFGFSKAFDPGHRLFDREMGGGALLDVGVYLASLASLYLGPPVRIASQARIGRSGVDEDAALLFGYEGDRFAQLTASITTTTPQVATLFGAAGSIRLHAPWWKADRLTVAVDGRDAETIHTPYVGNGYTHEAMEAMGCLRDGALESPLMPLDETVSVIETLDRVRAEWGLRYPGE
jgi:predicted dehydrogenase